MFLMHLVEVFLKAIVESAKNLLDIKIRLFELPDCFLEHSRSYSKKGKRVIITESREEYHQKLLNPNSVAGFVFWLPSPHCLIRIKDSRTKPSSRDFQSCCRPVPRHGQVTDLPSLIFNFLKRRRFSQLPSLLLAK